MALGGEPVAGPPTLPMDGLSQEGLDRNLSTAMIRNAKNVCGLSIKVYVYVFTC